MTATDDAEPKATVALLSRLLGDGDAKGEELMAPSVRKSASELLGEEVSRYLVLHPELVACMCMPCALVMPCPPHALWAAPCVVWKRPS